MNRRKNKYENYERPWSKRNRGFLYTLGKIRNLTVCRLITPSIHDGKTCITVANLPPRPMMGIESCGMLISTVHEEDGREGRNLLRVDKRILAGARLY